MDFNFPGFPAATQLYDLEGNPIILPDQESALQTTEVVEFLETVKEQLEAVDDLGTDLALDEEVNVYDYGIVDEVSREYYSIIVYGGKNGSGIWSNYFKALSNLMLRLEATFEDAWIMHLDIDVPDDLFQAEIGIRTWINQLDSTDVDGNED